MKITVYTITECQFSKQEKEYLSSHGLQFEEKNVSANREFLTEMLTVGSNFAGTPVTKIDTDDGKTVVLKGFTKEEFDKALGFAPVAAAPAQQQAAPIPAVETAPVAEVVQPTVAPTPAPVEQPPVAAAPQQPPVADPAIASILNNLEQQAQQQAPAPTPVEQPPVTAAPQQPPVAGQPTIPDPQF